VIPQEEDAQIMADYKAKPIAEGPMDEDDRDAARRGKAMERDLVAEQASAINIESEPPMTVEQIGQLETEIGAGLIEEVIQVAQAERDLVDVLKESQV